MEGEVVKKALFVFTIIFSLFLTSTVFSEDENKNIDTPKNQVFRQTVKVSSDYEVTIWFAGRGQLNNDEVTLLKKTLLEYPTLIVDVIGFEYEKNSIDFFIRCSSKPLPALKFFTSGKLRIDVEDREIFAIFIATIKVALDMNKKALTPSKKDPQAPKVLSHSKNVEDFLYKDYKFIILFYFTQKDFDYSFFTFS